ncbi:hypothetical protein QZH41_010118 [Actinostola sp. cb2023]|nr:hypothetical protein QZH41_010118 [Actinostola sp. cb2023]
MTFRAVSKEATNLAVMFSKPPPPTGEELESLLTGFETAVIGMLTVFHSLSLTQGKTLHKRLQITIVNILHDAKNFIESLKNEGCKSPQVINHSTGAIWEHCDSFHTLPLDNKYAVLEVLQTTSILVKDALTELDQIQKSNGCHDSNPLGDDDANVIDQGWSENDGQLVSPCAGMVKACRSCLKKVSDAIRTNSKTTSPANNKDLDDVSLILTTISPKVDDLISGLYAPISRENLQENVHQLADILDNLLGKSRASRFTLETDNSWIDFLKKAIDHNKTKLMAIMTEQLSL